MNFHLNLDSQQAILSTTTEWHYKNQPGVNFIILSWSMVKSVETSLQVSALFFWKRWMVEWVHIRWNKISAPSLNSMWTCVHGTHPSISIQKCCLSLAKSIWEQLSLEYKKCSAVVCPSRCAASKESSSQNPRRVRINVWFFLVLFLFLSTKGV